MKKSQREYSRHDPISGFPSEVFFSLFDLNDVLFTRKALKMGENTFEIRLKSRGGVSRNQPNLTSKILT